MIMTPPSAPEIPWCWIEGPVHCEWEAPDDDSWAGPPKDKIADASKGLGLHEVERCILTDKEILIYRFAPWTPPMLYLIPATEDRVWRFLERHRFLHPLLKEARWQINKYFSNVTASLRIYNYHDEPREEELVVYIHTSACVTEAMEKLEALLQGWWIDNLDRAEGRMGFDLHFT